MSVIFKALTRIKERSGSDADSAEARTASRSDTSLRRLVLSPMGLLFSLVAVGTTAAMAAYGLQRTLVQTEPAPVAAPAEAEAMDRPVAEMATVSPPSIDMAAPPEATRAEEPGTAGDFHEPMPEKVPLSGPNPPDPETVAHARYIPSQPVATVFSKFNGTPAPALPSRPANAENDTGQAAFAPAKMTATEPAGAKIQSPAGAHSPVAAVSGAPLKAPTPSGSALTVSKSTAATQAPTTEADEKKTGTDAAERKRLRRAAARRHRTAQLVARLQSQLAAGRFDQAERLLAQLTALKGRDDVFVQKMIAYWHLRQGRYKDAGLILDRLAARLPDDRETGLNLALVEIETGKMAAARQRLLRLFDIYPDDPAVVDLLTRLEKIMDHVSRMQKEAG